MTTDNKDKDYKDKLRGQLRNAIIIVIASWLVIPLGVIGLFGRPDSAGTLGDTFGIVNALFSALAFALLIYTSLMQREELELQRKELELTRRELEKSAEAQETLVNLTREQLELEKAIRKAEIRPELGLVSNGWKSSDRLSSYYKVVLRVKYYRLKLNKIEFTKNDKKLKLDDVGLSSYMDKYFSPNDTIAIALVPESNDRTTMSNVGLFIEFLDIDGIRYSQTLTISSDIGHISSVKDFQWGTNI